MYTRDCARRSSGEKLEKRDRKGLVEIEHQRDSRLNEKEWSRFLSTLMAKYLQEHLLRYISQTGITTWEKDGDEERIRRRKRSRNNHRRNIISFL